MVHENLKTSDNIRVISPDTVDRLHFEQRLFINSCSSSGQHLVRIQGSVLTHPGISVSTHSESVTTHLGSALLKILTADVVLETLDVLLENPGCVVTDHWMCQYRILDVHHIVSGTAIASGKKVFVQNKSNWLYQGI
jgi:hypothetical protein